MTPTPAAGYGHNDLNTSGRNIENEGSPGYVDENKDRDKLSIVEPFHDCGMIGRLVPDALS